MNEIKQTTPSEMGGLVPWLLVLFLYVFAFLILPADVFWSPDEGGKYLMMKSIRWDGRLTYTAPYFAANSDPSYYFYPGSFPNNDVYPQLFEDKSIQFAWPIGFALVSGAFNTILGSKGIYLLPLVSGWLSTFIVWRLFKSFDFRLPPWGVLLIGLGTPLWFYSLVFWEHTFVTLLALAALYIILAARRVSAVMVLCSFGMLAGALYLRREMAAFVLAVIVAFLITKLIQIRFSAVASQHKAFAIGSGIVLSLCFLSFVWIFTNKIDAATLFLNVRQMRELKYMGQLLGEQLGNEITLIGMLKGYLANIPYLLINFPEAESPLLPEIWGWIGMIAIVLCFIAAWIRNWKVEIALLLPGLLALLVIAVVVLLDTKSYRSLHGVFLLAPYLGLSFYVIPYAWRQKQLRLIFLSLVAALYGILGVLAILLIRASPIRGILVGLEWGPRYLLPFYPLGAMMTLVAIQIYQSSNRPKFIRRLVQVIVVGMMVIGIQFQVRGVLMLWESKNALMRLQTSLSEMVPAPIVTDIWWLPASLAVYYTEHEIYSITQLEDVSDWLQQMEYSSGFEFVVVSTEPVEGNRFSDSDRQVQVVEQTYSGTAYITRFQVISEVR
jgi:hypothetical protein